MSASACADPLDFSVLIDHWLGDLAPAEEERVEEHLLGCPACSQRLGDLVALTDGVRRLANLGVVRAVVTSAFLERLVDEGLRVREYRLVPGGSVECTVTPSDDLVAARLAADLRGAQQICVGGLRARIEPDEPQALEAPDDIHHQGMYRRGARHDKRRLRQTRAG